MSEYFTLRTDAITGEITQVPWTPEEIAAYQALPPPVIPVPISITRRQCALQLLAVQHITAQEALDMTKTATVPAAIASIFAGMPEDQRILAEIDFAATNYYRSNTLLTQMGLTDEQIDAFFIAAAQL